MDYYVRVVPTVAVRLACCCRNDRRWSLVDLDGQYFRRFLVTRIVHTKVGEGRTALGGDGYRRVAAGHYAPTHLRTTKGVMDLFDTASTGFIHAVERDGHIRI